MFGQDNPVDLFDCLGAAGSDKASHGPTGLWFALVAVVSPRRAGLEPTKPAGASPAS